MKTLATVMVMAALSTGLLASSTHADVTINIGAPPPIVVASPPRVVVVPGTAVYYAPAASHNLFVYGGSYYALHNGHWFHAKKPGAAWVFVPTDKVPRPVIGVPVSYYKIPPGHARKMGDGGGPGKGGKKGKGH
ncbi:MAG: hypothetical protein WED01_03020 [Candidatus Rokuibacteriota bacterium]